MQQVGVYGSPQLFLMADYAPKNIWATHIGFHVFFFYFGGGFEEDRLDLGGIVRECEIPKESIAIICWHKK